MQYLQLEYSLIHQDVNLAFERIPEPKPENLGPLSEKVIARKADIGFAFDPDGDRLALVDEKGNILGENWTLAIAYLCVLKYHTPKNPDIFVNLSTSLLLENIAKTAHAKVFRTCVGEIYVTQALQKQSGEIGGEGNGGVIYPALNPCRDSILAILFVLEYLAREKRKLSDIVAEFPSYHSVATKIPCDNHHRSIDLATLLIDVLKSLDIMPDHTDTQDGIWISYSTGWIHLRHSNTEPIIRIMGESSDLTSLSQIVQNIEQKLHTF